MKQHKYSKRKLAKRDAQYKRMRDELMYPTSDGTAEMFLVLCVGVFLVTTILYIISKVV